VGNRAEGWHNPDQLMEGMFTLSRVISTIGPLHCFLTLDEIDRGRPAGQLLTPQTVRLLADKYPRFGDQYPVFAEFHGLNDASIARFFVIAESLSQIPDRLLRADALGTFEANLGLWQILARQGQIPDASLNESWQQVMNAFGSVHSSAAVFDAGEKALGNLLGAATGKRELPQDQILALLAGPEQTSKEGRQLHLDVANRMRQVLDDQRLVSLDTLHGLGDGLTEMASGKDASGSLLILAGELREFEMPKPFIAIVTRPCR
jgi:hypothetical protein